MNYLGIDPGKSGGLVLIGPTGCFLSKEVMPVDSTGELDKNALQDLLLEWHTWDSFHVFLERIIPFALNAKGALNFGRQLGMIELMLWYNKWAVTFVEPAKWMKEMHQGINNDIKPKAKSIIAVERLYPGVDLRADAKSKKNHEGLIDAILIAEYGRRRLGKSVSREV